MHLLDETTFEDLLRIVTADKKELVLVEGIGKKRAKMIKEIMG